MATTKEIKRRIKSVKNTKKITKAMELVAASKMRRAVNNTLSSRTYAQYAWEILQSLSKTQAESAHPLLELRPVKNVLVVLVTSNRGLCGAYNSLVIKRIINFIKEDTRGLQLEFVAIGKKGETALRRMGQQVVATFPDLPDNLSLRDTNPVSRLIIEEFKAKKYDQVMVAYTDYVSALTQKPQLKQLLPISVEDLKKVIENLDDGQPQVTAPSAREFLFEPDYKMLMPIIIEKLSAMQIYQMILESLASEQSARMVAMRNASDAAGEMIDTLTLVYNKARQAGITQEISEISAGSASVS